MRITFVLPGFNLSGGLRVVAIHAGWLQRKGHVICVVAPREPPIPLVNAVKSLLKGQGWPKRQEVQPSHFDGLPIQQIRLPYSLRVDAADIPDADIIVATWWETANWIADLPPAKGVKAHFVQGYEAFSDSADKVDAVYRSSMPKIVVSSWLRDLLQNKFKRTPVALVPNSVDPSAFHAPERGKQAQPTVGMIYSTEHIKGTDISLKAFDLAAKQLPSLKMVTMSNRPAIDSLPLPAGTKFVLQARDQTLRDTYASADVWLSTSREEGFGLPILEAMACRTPVIATPFGAAPELVGKGGGVLVPFDDPPATAAAIVQICSLPDHEWKELSNQALRTATSFSWDDAAQLFEQALMQVLQGPASR